MGRQSSRNKLMALCSVAALCAVGYGVVEVNHGSASQSAQTQSSANRASSGAARTATAASIHSSASTNKKATAKTTVKQKYKDGTYSGVGYERIGAVQVSVTLKKDKIVACKITNSSTHYPISYIDPVLPNELLARQNPNKIDVVSGATLSTYDFYYAVQSCLQQAQKAQANA